MTRSISRAARLATVAGIALALSVCGEPPTGLRNEGSALARLAFQPELRPTERPLFQASGLSIDNVFLIIRNAAGVIVFERIVPFPAGQNEIAISADVLVNGESERFRASFELRSGTTVMYSGAQDVVVRPGLNAATPTTVPLVFVGPGASAASVAVTPTTLTLLAGASAPLTATARRTRPR